MVDDQLGLSYCFSKASLATAWRRGWGWSQVQNGGAHQTSEEGRNGHRELDRGKWALGELSRGLSQDLLMHKMFSSKQELFPLLLLKAFILFSSICRESECRYF